MAAGILSAPGSEYGPCEGACVHTDCAATRKMAEADCEICNSEINYGIRFYRQDNGTYVHAECLEIILYEKRFPGQ
jgi:hypothetical protein